jgi:LacI family transcriptional regulator
MRVSIVVDNDVEGWHMRPTIRDVAFRAGVSVAAVSKVINGRYGVSAATSARVQAVIDELGYESSLAAQSLRSHRTGVIGVLVSDIEPFSAEVLKGAAAAIRGSGYELVVYSAGRTGPENAGWERRYLSRISGTLTDGSILVTPSVVEIPAGAPVVAVDPLTTSTGVPAVSSDNLAGAIMATEHLIGLGHRRIGFIGGRSDLESARLREHGYREALAAAGLGADPGLMRSGGYHAEEAAQAARELLDLREPPTAIFAASDLMAIQTMRVAVAAGLPVPHDLSIIGFDNVPESALTAPPLSTIDQSIQRMGAEAIRMLLALIDGTAPAETRICLPTHIVSRASTSVPPRRSAYPPDPPPSGCRGGES